MKIKGRLLWEIKDRKFNRNRSINANVTTENVILHDQRHLSDQNIINTNIRTPSHEVNIPIQSLSQNLDDEEEEEALLSPSNNNHSVDITQENQQNINNVENKFHSYANDDHIESTVDFDGNYNPQLLAWSQRILNVEEKEENEINQKLLSQQMYDGNDDDGINSPNWNFLNSQNQNSSSFILPDYNLRDMVINGEDRLIYSQESNNLWKASTPFPLPSSMTYQKSDSINISTPSLINPNSSYLYRKQQSEQIMETFANLSQTEDLLQITTYSTKGNSQENYHELSQHYSRQDYSQPLASSILERRSHIESGSKQWNPICLENSFQSLPYLSSDNPYTVTDLFHKPVSFADADFEDRDSIVSSSDDGSDGDSIIDNNKNILPQFEDCNVINNITNSTSNLEFTMNINRNLTPPLHLSQSQHSQWSQQSSFPPPNYSQLPHTLTVKDQKLRRQHTRSLREIANILECSQTTPYDNFPTAEDKTTTLATSYPSSSSSSSSSSSFSTSLTTHHPAILSMSSSNLQQVTEANPILVAEVIPNTVPPTPITVPRTLSCTAA